MVTAIVYVVVNLVVLTMGLLIRSGMTWLIAGYDASLIRDEKGLARYAGSNIMGIGVAGILAGILMYLLPDYAVVFVLAFPLLVIVMTIRLLIGIQRFTK
jgi:hypothetical protein